VREIEREGEVEESDGGWEGGCRRRWKRKRTERGRKCVFFFAGLFWLRG